MKAFIAYFGLSLLFWSAEMSYAHCGGATAFAVPVTGIELDGSLDDWPQGMIWYPIVNQAQAYGPTDIDNVDLTASPDLTARFMVGYDLEDDLIYVAVRVRDDSVAVSRADFWHTDACEVVVEGPHLGRKITSWSSAGDSPALVYVMWPPGGGYGKGMNSADDAANPNLMGGDITRTRTRGAYARESDISIYEWAIEPFDHYPDAPTKLEIGKSMGFEIFVVDKDRKSDNPACLTWAPFGPNKRMNTDLLGDLVLLESASDLGTISGTVVEKTEKTEKTRTPCAGLTIEAYREGGEGEPAAYAHTDTEGRYELRLLPGRYVLRPQHGQGFKPTTVKALTVRRGRETAADFTVRPVQATKELARAAAVYKALQGYRDSTIVQVYEVRPGIETLRTTRMGFAFERPNRVRLESTSPWIRGAASVFSDGVMLTTYIATMGRAGRQQYVQKRAPAQIIPADLQSSMVAPGGGVWLHQVLMSDDPLKELMKGVENVERVEHVTRRHGSSSQSLLQPSIAADENLGGIPVTVLALTRPAGSLIAMGPPASRDKLIEVRLWIDKKDFLIRQMAFEIDMSGIAEEMPAEQRA